MAMLIGRGSLAIDVTAAYREGHRSRQHADALFGAVACATMCHMTTISIRELHLRTGAWVKRAAELGSITVTERGRPVARLEAIAERGRENRFLSRKLRPGYKRLRGKLTGGTDTVTIVSEGREGR